MGFLMALAQPGPSARLAALQIAANREAASGHRRALDELSRIQEEAERASRLAARQIEPSAAIRLAEERASQARAAEKEAKVAASATAEAYYVHLAARPAGWRRVIAWATGGISRHEAREAALEEAKIAAEAAERERIAESRAARRRVEQATEAHNRAAADLRNRRRQDADAATLRSENATRALALIEQRPALASMGVEALLQLGRRLLDRESVPAADPSAVLKPAADFVP